MATFIPPTRVDDGDVLDTFDNLDPSAADRDRVWATRRVALIKGGMMDNLLERSAHMIRFTHFKQFETFHLRYLTYDMRQFLWKAVLFDPREMTKYQESLQRRSPIRRVRQDEVVMLDLKRILLSEQEWVQDVKKQLLSSSANLQMATTMMVYIEEELGRHEITANESYFYLLAPLFSTFSSYEFQYKYQYLISMYLTMIREIHRRLAKSSISNLEEFQTDYFLLNGVFLSTLKKIDPELGEHFDDLMKVDVNSFRTLKRRADNLREDALAGDNRYFLVPMSKDIADSVLKNGNDVILYDYIKRFVERLSTGFVSLEITKIIIDALLTKRYKVPNDAMLIQALCVIVFLLRDDGIFEAETLMDVFRVIERKALTEIHEFEFFTTFRNLFAKKGDSLSAVINQDKAPAPMDQMPTITTENMDNFFQPIQQTESNLVQARLQFLSEQAFKKQAKQEYDEFEVVPFEQIKREGGTLLPQLDMQELQNSTTNLLQQQEQEALSSMKQEEEAMSLIKSKIANQISQQMLSRGSRGTGVGGSSGNAPATLIPEQANTASGFAPAKTEGGRSLRDKRGTDPAGAKSIGGVNQQSLDRLRSNLQDHIQSQVSNISPPDAAAKSNSGGGRAPSGLNQISVHDQNVPPAGQVANDFAGQQSPPEETDQQDALGGGDKKKKKDKKDKKDKKEKKKEKEAKKLEEQKKEEAKKPEKKKGGCEIF